MVPAFAFSLLLLYRVPYLWPTRQLTREIASSCSHRALRRSCLAAAVFFVYQVFFVRLAYDDESIYCRSPLSGSHRIPWTDVLKVGYSGLMQSHYLRTEKVPRIWCSNMLQGYEELGAFLSQKADQLFGGDET